MSGVESGRIQDSGSGVQFLVRGGDRHILKIRWVVLGATVVKKENKNNKVTILRG